MKTYKIKIKKASLENDKFGQNIKVTMVGIYDENGKWIKWTKLNQEILDILLTSEIEITL